MSESKLRLRTDVFDDLCKSRGLRTQKAVSEALKMSPAQLGKVRAGSLQPGPKFIDNSMAYFEVPYVVLFFRESSKVEAA